ncbi:hypothetical protein SAMN04515667_0905 [Formosa sp. Hel1_31_208]|uniref:hypothetical protein n=1 Tax=Formosa sp. Hel1_31_208 TaxID=1798225 RepID=UPI00087A6006|nr:hypothetical protein [Formosa sp. Hel1_31_208]SDR88347.1 hypothetical protein SAMN04515667_0905 [Formosa sp. Hel1_31_208]
MFFEELTTHLFNLKVLATLDLQKIGISDYLESIKDSRKLITESKLKEQETNLNYKQVQQIIDKSGEVSFDTFYDETTSKITNLLKDIEIEEPLFGEIRIELKNILETTYKCKKLDEYIFGKELIRNLNNSIKSKKEILSYYIKLKDVQLGNSFINYLKLLDSVKTPLKTSLSNLKEELEKTLKNKNQEEKRTHIRELHNLNKIKLRQSPYLVVNDVINYDYNNDIDLANFLDIFIKTNTFESQNLIDLKPFFITIFFDAYMKQNYNAYLEVILVNKDEIFALLQDRNSLSELVLPANIRPFEDLERQLIKEEYFDSSAKWINQKKQLVEFILHCRSLAYFKIRADVTDNTEIRKLRHFFEKRYSINITNQFKPNQRKLIKLPSYEFRWIEKAF